MKTLNNFASKIKHFTFTISYNIFKPKFFFKSQTFL